MDSNHLGTALIMGFVKGLCFTWQGNHVVCTLNALENIVTGKIE